jgi:transcriptional regulator with XRE-family HTH domain
MKKEQTIREMLGLTQDDLALLLQVNRSQLAMYEIGQRDLPRAAKEQILDMLTFINDNASASVENETYMIAQKLQKEKKLSSLLLKNKHQQGIVEKKITAFEKKFQANLRAIKLVGYIEDQAAKKGKSENLFIKSISNKALAEIDKEGLGLLTQLQIKKEMLEQEEQLLIQYSSKIQ